MKNPPHFLKSKLCREFARKIGEYIHIGGIIDIVDLNRHLCLIGISGEFDRYIRSNTSKNIKIRNNVEELSLIHI